MMIRCAVPAENRPPKPDRRCAPARSRASGGRWGAARTSGKSMEPLVIVGGIACVVVIAPLILYAGMYNGLIGLRNRVRESWSDIDTELKRRYDLIPNLVSTVKGYAAHEQGIFEKIAQLRSQAMGTNSHETQLTTEKELSKALSQVLVAVESYPQLKANENFLKLMKELAMTEDRIQAARRFYNANVRDYNIKIESFPSNFVASMHHCTRETFFDLESLDMRNLPALKL